MTSKLQKTIARQQVKIAEGQYYEAHQQLRVIASRYIKASDFEAAADILSSGSISLLSAGHGGSGGDLAVMLLAEVYNKAEWTPEGKPEKKARLLEILKAFPPEEPTRKKFIGEMIGWSARFGELDRGDPDMHHAAGCLYADENEPYDAERHLVLGNDQSPERLALLQYSWYTFDASHTAAIYASRCTLPYLLVGNLRRANKAFLIFTSRLSAAHPALGVQQVSSTKSDMRVHPSLPLMNFLGLLLLAVPRGSNDLFKTLIRHYSPYIDELGGIWNDAMAKIGEMYFGIRIPRQGNPLMDMMGSMFFGGGGAAAKPKPKPAAQAKKVEAPPSMDLD